MTARNSFHMKVTETQKQPGAVRLAFPAEGLVPPDRWLQSREDARSGALRSAWAADGVVVLRNLLSPAETAQYAALYDDLLEGRIDAGRHRHDLGSNVAQKTATENITQIMWPFDYMQNELHESPVHARTLAVARHLLGDDAAFDFDMLIYKAPGTDTETPFHQDEGYWPDMPDKRAVSCWVALDEATPDNGCMWHVRGSHKRPLAKHAPAAPGSHVLTAVDPRYTEADAEPCPLRPGDAVLHHGRVVHYTRGNTTGTRRRAYITNFRPQSMVEWERRQGYSHGKEGMDTVDHSSLPTYGALQQQTRLKSAL
eukprot:TRINITY_DN52508_c0_g1_i1.p1 TRINITY_DN52508_c0_g1~~TRINITY_DN52508_c0_g1_i1.p1  ORF type:complete len:312 (+),score=76.17 TRINITY_DN52508_c0_g1_i1:77-1012(+)